MRWKLFAVINYLFLLFYGFVLFKLVQSLIEDPPPGGDSFEAFSGIAAIAIIVFNSGFNILVFHFHVPQKPLSQGRSIMFICSAILYAISIGWLLYMSRNIWDYELISENTDSLLGLMKTVYVSTFVLGLFVLIQQLLLAKFLKEKQALSFNKMIEEIGKKEE